MVCGIPTEAFEAGMQAMQERVRRAGRAHSSKEVLKFPCDLRTIFTIGVEAMLDKWDEIDASG